MKESQLENKTAIATNDYVRMVDENGNSVKIKKDSFMAAIRDALPSIISDGATDGGSVLSIIGGALKTRTDANLASVLGVNSHFFNYIFTADASEKTIDVGKYGFCIVMIQNSSVSTFGSLFLVSWNSNTNLIIVQEDNTKNTNPARPVNGSSSIVLSNLKVNNTYNINVIFFE